MIVDTWTAAYERTSERIRSHPDFPRLVREVAVAEQPRHPGYMRLSLNSPTMATWMTRDMPRRRTGPLNRRAWSLAQQIAGALDIWPTLPKSEGEARVYGEARDHVRARTVTWSEPDRIKVNA